MANCSFNRAHILWALFFLFPSLAWADYDKPNGARRDQGVARFLNVSVRVNRGSGTICHYDAPTGLTHILTCAHIIGKDNAVEVETFLVNGQEKQILMAGKVLAIDRIADLCLIAAVSKTTLDYAPIDNNKCDVFYPSLAPAKRKLVVCGRDNGTKPALYEAFVVTTTTDEYLQSRQYPSQGGRSGGGVFNEHKRIVGVNVKRIERQDAIGTGLWVPCWKIHGFLKEYGQEWLIQGQVMSKIPVIDGKGRILKVVVPHQ